MHGRRVAVTGVGAISALGPDATAFWDSLVAGRSGIRAIESVDHTTLKCPNGAEVHGFVAADHFPDRAQQGLDRFAQFALVTAREAIADSGLAWDDTLRDRTAVVTGTGNGGTISLGDNYERFYGQGNHRMPPGLIPSAMANAGASQVSMEFGFRGPTFTLSTACASSTHAIGHAFWLVRNGGADAAVCGGSEALFTLPQLKAWEALRVMSPDTCRPFSRQKSGMILGEGGAMLVLEPLDSARRRGARIYAELAGFGMSADAAHLTAPSEDGPLRAMQAALDDASTTTADVDYINAHGTGTPGNDPNEIRAIGRLLGEHAEQVAVSSTKSMHGHAIGAAGALEAVATALAVHHGVIPPTANLDEVDPECPLDVVPNQSRTRSIRTALSNSFAFGGLNAVLVFRRVDPAGD